MAEIKPFKALQFNPNLNLNLSDLICPPYDVISPKEQILYYKKNKYNMIRLELPIGKSGYQHAFNTLTKWKKENILISEKSDCLYLYEQEFLHKGTIKKTTGLICLVKLENFEKKVIIPHENTLSKPKLDRLKLLKSTFCNFSPIYALYNDETMKTKSKIENFLKNKPDMEATDEYGVTHKIFKIYNKDIIQQICKDFKDRNLFIADGHHRYETSLEFKNFCKQNNIDSKNGLLDYTMMFLVNASSTSLAVFPTHRVIRRLNKFKVHDFIINCKKYFTIIKTNSLTNAQRILDIYKKNNKTIFAFYCGKKSFYLMLLKDKTSVQKILHNTPRALRKLDVTILHSIVFDKILNKNFNNNFHSKDILYTRNAKKAIQLVNKHKAKCAFILNPTTIPQIIDVANNNEKMPQKSTYFFPKPTSGLLFNEL